MLFPRPASGLRSACALFQSRPAAACVLCTVSRPPTVSLRGESRRAWSVLWDTLCEPPPAEQVPVRCSLSAERPLEGGWPLWPSSHGLGEAMPRTDQWLPTRAPHAPAHCQTYLRKQVSVALEPIKSWSRDRPESVSELQSYSRGCLGKRDGRGGTGRRRGEGKGEGREERGREASATLSLNKAWPPLPLPAGNAILSSRQNTPSPHIQKHFSLHSLSMWTVSLERRTRVDASGPLA